MMKRGAHFLIILMLTLVVAGCTQDGELEQVAANTAEGSDQTEDVSTCGGDLFHPPIN